MVNYIEEENVGLDLQPATFCPSNKTCFAISGKYVISYDAEVGRRQKFFPHSENVIGAHFVDKKFITITENGTVTSWDWKNGKELFKADIQETVNLIWSYEVTTAESDAPDIYVYGRITASCDDSGVMEVDESSSDNSTCNPLKTSLFQVNLIDADGQFRVTLTHSVDIPDAIPSKRHLSVSANFAAVIKGRELKIIPLAHFKGKINGPLSFLHQLSFNMSDARSIAFNDIRALDDAVFVALNIGRIYFWSQIREAGLHHTNKTYLDVSPSSFVMALTSSRFLFTGDGMSSIAKWNMLSTGAGRVRSGEYLRMPAPVERLHLSADTTFLLAVLSDNSLYVVRTATMTIQCRAQALHWSNTVPPLDWSKLNIDPSFPSFLVTNSRIGHIQWIEPAKWKTLVEFDVSEENSPPRDHFNAPNYLWLNVYLLHLSVTRLITCERRRNDLNKTYMKIYRRIRPDIMADFHLEESIVCQQRVSFVRSNFDEVTAGSSPSDAKVNGQSEQEEIVRILDNGQVDVFVPDAFRLGHWRVDPNRQCALWRKSVIRSCSRVHANVFATVNEVHERIKEDEEDASQLDYSHRSKRKSSIGEMESSINTSLHSSTDDEREHQEKEGRNYVLLWQLPVTLRIFQIIDCIPDATQVEWAPSQSNGTSVVLIASAHGIFGYNPQSASLIWRVERPGLSLFSSQLTCFVYDSNSVVFFDPLIGTLKRVTKFENPQEQIVASGGHKNVRISGLSRQGLCVLKSKYANNNISCSQSSVASKKTPFSQLVSKADSTETPEQNDVGFVQLQAKIPTASKIFDGPAHTLAPISQLAPLYIRSCLTMRRKD